MGRKGSDRKARLAKAETTAKETHVHPEPRRGARFSIDHMTYYTPLQDYAGIITPAPLHFMQYHSSHLPEIDAKKHRLTIHGLVDRPLSFSMDDLKSLPSVSRVHFLECHGNSSRHDPWCRQPEHGAAGPVRSRDDQLQRVGRRAAVRAVERGRREKRGDWLVSEGADPGKFSHTLPIAKAMDDVIVAYGQNGEPLRVEQGYPIRLVVPGWEAPFSVKYLSHIKVVDQPYNTWNESMNHSIARPDLGGKSRWYHFQFGTEIGDHAAVGGTENAGPRLCADYRLGLVGRRRGHQGRRIHRRRQELEGSEAPDPGAFEGAYPLYFRLGLGRAGGDAPVALHG